eukprot:11208878-Lingulodinium_polyedra.AAC.1
MAVLVGALRDALELAVGRRELPLFEVLGGVDPPHLHVPGVVRAAVARAGEDALLPPEERLVETLGCRVVEQDDLVEDPGLGRLLPLERGQDQDG